MAVPRRRSKRYTHCQICKRSREAAGGLSLRGLCSICGEAARTATILDLTAKRGPLYEKYRQAVIRALYQGVREYPTADEPLRRRRRKNP